MALHYCALFIILNILLNQEIHCEKTVATINGITKTLDKSTSCDPKEWDNSQQNACSCCIVKHKYSGDMNSDEIIKYCTEEKKYCNDAILQKMMKDEQVSSKDQLVDKLYDKSIVIKKVDFDKSLLAKNGNLTKSSIIEFLNKAYKENKLANPHFSDPSRLSAKDLMTKAGATGMNLSQLFMVTYNSGTKKFNYIVKQMGKGTTESKNIETIRHVPGIEELIAPSKIENFPMLAIPSDYLSYNFGNKTNYLALMPAAPGVPLGNLILQYNDNPSEQNEKVIKEAHYAIGKQLANFYRRFMQPHIEGVIAKTLVHGDLHSFNLFYDEKTKQATFIDIETMADSVKNPREIYIDLVKLLYVPIAGAVKTEKGIGLAMLKNADKQKWIDIAIGSFIEGYLSVYWDEEKRQILEELHKIFKQAPAKTIHLAIALIFINPIEVQSLINKYVNPLFDRIKKELNSKTQE